MNVSYRNIVAYSSEIAEAFRSPLHNGLIHSSLIHWFSPISARVKLNTDGSYYESTGKADFGGLFIDHKSGWLKGYYGKLRYNTSLETELWSIYRGLTMILEKGWSFVCIEIDSQEHLTSLRRSQFQITQTLASFLKLKCYWLAEIHNCPTFTVKQTPALTSLHTRE